MKTITASQFRDIFLNHCVARVATKYETYTCDLRFSVSDGCFTFCFLGNGFDMSIPLSSIGEIAINEFGNAELNFYKEKIIVTFMKIDPIDLTLLHSGRS